jgi:hypothetical protein
MNCEEGLATSAERTPPRTHTGPRMRVAATTNVITDARIDRYPD